MASEARLPRRHLRHASVAQVSAHHGDELCECDLRLLDFGVPPLFPFEVIVSAVPELDERLDLAAHGDLARAGEDIAAVPRRGGRWNRVLEVHVPDVAPELPYGVFRLLMTRDECVVRVPEEGHRRRVRLSENLEQRGRVGEVTV